MNILLITDDFYPNKAGIAHTVSSLCKYFQDSEHILYVVNPYFEGKNIFDIYEKKAYKLIELLHFLKKKKQVYLLINSILRIFRDKKIKLFHRINLVIYLFSKPKLLLHTINNTSRIYSYFKKLRIDLIFSAHSGEILPLSFILSRLFQSKIVSMAHGLDFLINSYFSLKTFYFKYIDKIIVSSNWVKRLLMKIQLLNEDKLVIIHRGLILKDYTVKESKNQLRKELDVPEKAFVILSVGRHVSRKKFDLVIRAVKKLKETDPMINVRYYLIGSGPMTPDLKTLTNQLKLRENIVFLGSSDMITRNKFYKLSDIFIMPAVTEKNNIEGFGIVFLEANYYKIPVIGSYSGGIVEAIVNGKTGLLIQPNNLDDLVDKITFLYKNEKERKVLGENGYKRVIAEFNWDKIIYDYLDVFRSALNS